MGDLSQDTKESFDILCERLTDAAQKKGNIKLETSTADAIKAVLKACRTSGRKLQDSEIARLVSNLDQPKRLCRRLDSMSFGLILETLLHAEYSRQKERGIILLSESFIPDPHRRTFVKSIKERKVKIGTECIQTLLTCFTETSENPRIRRWVGILLLQIFGDNEKSLFTFGFAPEDRKRKLGTMVLEEQNELLRVTCGQLLKSLIAWEIPPRDLWPIGTDSRIYSEFPVSSQMGQKWSRDFQNYIDQHFDTSKSSQSTGGIYFPYAVKFNPSEFIWSDCRINVFISGDLSLCTDLKEKSMAESIEIPFEIISDVSIDNTQVQGVPQVIQGLSDLVIGLKSVNGVLCHRNAIPFTAKELRITLQDETAADIIGHDLNTARFRPKVSKSMQPIPVGSTFTDEKSYGDTVNFSLQEITGVVSNGNDFPDGQGTFFESAAFGIANIRNETVRGQHDPMVDEGRVGDQADNEIEGQTSKILDFLPETIEPLATLSNKPESRLNGGISSPSSALVDDERRPENQLRAVTESVATISDQPVINSHELRPASPKSDVKSKVAQRKGTSASYIDDGPQSSEDLDDPDSSYPSPIARSKRKQKRKRLSVKETLGKEDSAIKSTISKPPQRRPKKEKLKPKSVIGFKKSSVVKSVTFPSLDPRQSRTEIQPGPSDLDLVSVPLQKLPRPSRPVAQKALATQRLEAPTKIVTSKKKVFEEVDFRVEVSSEKVLAKKNFSTQLSLALYSLDDVEQIDTKSPERAKETFVKNQPTSSGPKIQTPSSIARRSPQLRQHREDLLLQNDLPNNAPAQQVTLSATPLRPNSRPLNSTKEATLALNSVLMAKMPLVDSYLARKTPIVGFSAKGPRNQGRMSANKLSLPRLKFGDKPSITRSQDTKIVRENGIKTKRSAEGTEEQRVNKRLQNYKIGTSAPPVTPRRRTMSNHSPEIADHEEEVPSVSFRNPYVLGSQGSRVDENGSPRASNPALHQDNYSSMAKKVLQNAEPTDLSEKHEVGDEFIGYVDEDEELPTILNSVQSPELDAYGHSGILRARSFSPDVISAPISKEPSDRVIQYEPHRTVMGRQYVVKTNEVIAHKAKLLDPFREEGGDLESSKFARRLQSETRGNKRKKPATSPVPCSPRKRRTSPVEDLEATLVQLEAEDSVDDSSLSSEGTSGKSSGSRDIRRLSTPVRNRSPGEQWRMALLPHQKGIVDALYQISDDLVRYLISHEDAIEDVVHRYHSGGIKLIDKLGKDHREDQRRVRKELEEAKKVLGQGYRESWEQMNQIIQILKGQPVHELEKKWLREQEIMQRLIREGR